MSAGKPKIIDRVSDDIEVIIGRPRGPLPLGNSVLRRLGRGRNSGKRSSRHGGVSQRVMVKARTVKHGNGGSGARKLKQYVRYMSKDSAGKDSGRARVFSGGGDVSREEVSLKMDSWANDPHSFRFIVSPERGRDVDVNEYAHALVCRAERLLNTKLECFYSAHFDTDQPHIHLIIRGVTDEGRTLFIPRDFFRSSFREACEQEMTLRLGERGADSIYVELQRNVSKKGICSLDYGIFELGKRSEHGEINLTEHWFSSKTEFSLAKNRVYQERLDYLGKLGLATHIGAGKWLFPEKSLSVLRTLSKEGEIKERFRKIILESGAGVVIAHGDDNPLSDEVLGEVLWCGSVDELADDRAVLVEGVDGIVRFIPLGRYTDFDGFEPAVGAYLLIAPATAKNKVEEVVDRELKGEGGSFNVAAFENKVLQAVKDESWALVEGLTVPDYISMFRTRLESLVKLGVITKHAEDAYQIPQDFVSAARKALHVSAGNHRVNGSLFSRFDLDRLIQHDGATRLEKRFTKPLLMAGRVGLRMIEALSKRAEVLRGRGIQVGPGTYGVLRADELLRRVSEFNKQIGLAPRTILWDGRRGDTALVRVLGRVLVSDGSYLIVHDGKSIWHVRDSFPLGQTPSIGDEIQVEKGKKDIHVVKSYSRQREKGRSDK